MREYRYDRIIEDGFGNAIGCKKIVVPDWVVKDIRTEAIEECMQILKANHMMRTLEDDFVPDIEIETYRHLFERFKQLKESE